MTPTAGLLRVFGAGLVLCLALFGGAARAQVSFMCTPSRLWSDWQVIADCGGITVEAQLNELTSPVCHDKVRIRHVNRRGQKEDVGLIADVELVEKDGRSSSATSCSPGGAGTTKRASSS